VVFLFVFPRFECFEPLPRIENAFGVESPFYGLHQFDLFPIKLNSTNSDFANPIPCSPLMAPSKATTALHQRFDAVFRA
jgi:hypothetical protein